MKTIYAANGYIEPHGLWDILDWKELQNHTEAIGIFLETITYQIFRHGRTNIKRKTTNPTQIESVLGRKMHASKSKPMKTLDWF
jgi:uncharacterized membrane protein (DUF2068 family)